MKMHVSPKDLAPQPISAGVYKGLLSAIKTLLSSNKNTMLNCEWTIQSQGPITTEKTIGRKVFDRLMIMESTLWRVFALTKIIGGIEIPENDYSEEELASFVSHAILNKVAVLEVDVEEYQGTPRNIITKITAIQ